MSEVMRKIVYYENILEFKENTSGVLLKTELNNWQLCRTCLFETVPNDLDLEKMCVMDMMEGRFLNVKEMLMQATGFEVSREDELPLQICKDCLSKITTLYYFTLQVRKAENVLKRLANKLKTQNQSETTTIVDTTTPDESHTYKEQNVIEEVEMNILNDIEPDNDQCYENTVANVKCFPDLINQEDLDNKDDMILKDEEEQEDFKNIDYLEELEEEEEEHYLDNDFQATPDVHNVEVVSKSEHIDEDVIILAEEFEDNVNTNDSEQVQSYKLNNLTEICSKKGYKHKQPRVKKSLLDNIKCAICEKVFCRQRDLISHVQLSHPNSKAFKCRECDIQFAHMQSLSRHMNVHKDSLVKNTCEYCSKSFLRCDDFKRHIRVHTGERPYLCEMCDKAFKQQCEMKAHLMTHFPLTRQYNCDQCDRSFQSRNGLYLHKKSHDTQVGDTKIIQMVLNSKCT